MSVADPVAQPSPAAEGPAETSTTSGTNTNNPLEGLNQAHSDLVKWCYQPHGSLADEQLKKLDEASVKREHVAYGFIALLSLYLLAGQQAFFLSALIAFTYPACVSVKVVRTKNSAEALNLLLYWIPFGFAALLDSTFVSDLPAYFFLKTCALTFLFLPQTQGAKLIYFYAIEPLAKLLDDSMKKYS
ncbi:hypothetical protein KIN20_021588 [Parelaphostrongylus tenuis]|uniref:Receptor expression-enhancing protein n=1 Tax=Parelaphostrongylus tenuis TaxID=148309 RepID=A0AAD5QUA8_PARTN|nr:hypothetical protein KIN20_021588 [Parelaphostrongylus tenuis]